MLSNKTKFLRRWGPVRTLYSLLLRICRKFLPFSINAIYCRPLVRANGSSSPSDGCDFRILTEQEILDFSHDPALQFSNTRIKEALARGEYCIGAILDGELVAYTWRAYSTTRVDNNRNIWVDFSADARYGRNSFTLPAYRGRRIMSSLWAFDDRRGPYKGRTFHIGLVDTDNYPSLRAHMRVGSRVVGYAGYIYLFGKLFSFRTPGGKKVGCRFFTPRSPRSAVR